MFLGQGVLWQQVWNCLSNIQNLPRNAEWKVFSGESKSLTEYTTQLKETLSDLSGGLGMYDVELNNPHKRRRRDSVRENLPRPPEPSEDNKSFLPPDDLVDDLVEIYFKNIHPWIPILH